MSRLRLVGFGLALGLIASQAGHLLVYQVRYGAAATQLQSVGAHAYFPAVVKTGLGLLAAFLLLALVAIGLARLLAGRRLESRRLESGATPSLLRVVAVLFCFQLTCFVVQESMERAAGAPAVTAPALLLWGSIGQLPVALVAALVLRWFAVRVAPAVAGVLAPAATAIRIDPQVVVLVVHPAPIPIPIEDPLIRTFNRRGPPL